MGNKHRYVVAALALAGALSFGVFVWPTRYRYDYQSHFPARTDRITGRREVLTRSLPDNELSQLRATASVVADTSVAGGGFLTVSVYNGSNWDIDEVTILVHVVPPTDVSQTLWSPWFRALPRREQRNLLLASDPRFAELSAAAQWEILDRLAEAEKPAQPSDSLSTEAIQV